MFLHVTADHELRRHETYDNSGYILNGCQRRTVPYGYHRPHGPVSLLDTSRWREIQHGSQRNAWLKAFPADREGEHTQRSRRASTVRSLHGDRDGGSTAPRALGGGRGDGSGGCGVIRAITAVKWTTTTTTTPQTGRPCTDLDANLIDLELTEQSALCPLAQNAPPIGTVIEPTGSNGVFHRFFLCTLYSNSACLSVYPNLTLSLSIAAKHNVELFSQLSSL